MSSTAKPALLLVVALMAGCFAGSGFLSQDNPQQSKDGSANTSDLTLASSGSNHSHGHSHGDSHSHSHSGMISASQPDDYQRKETPVEFWPPVTGQRYPELVLENSNGQPVRLSDHAGKIILVELVAVPCKGCQAFAGGHKYGGFAGVGVQPDLDSIHKYAKRFAGIDLESNPDVLFVQLLLYGKTKRRPTQEETRGWAEHFQMNGNDHQIVLRGDASMLSRISYNMIPGFHLIDRDFVLRSDSCGHNPNENLYTDLLPKLKTLTQEPRAVVRGKQQENPFLAE